MAFLDLPALLGPSGTVEPSYTTPLGNLSNLSIVGTTQDNTNTIAFVSANNDSSNALGTSSLELRSGKVNNALSAGSTGSVEVGSGPSISAAEGVTGLVVVSSGASSGNGSTGLVEVSSGNVQTGISGDVRNHSGHALGIDGGTGAVDIYSGSIIDSGEGTTGSVSLSTGDADEGDSGSINILTGASNSGTRGSLVIDARTINVSGAPVKGVVAEPTDDDEAASKKYVDDQIALAISML